MAITDTLPPVAIPDLSDDASFASGFPQDAFTWLREHDPVHWHPPTAKTPDGDGFWVVSRYDDIMTVLRDPGTYSSQTGGGRTGGGTTLKDERAAGKTLNYTDDPRHRLLRSLVNKGFDGRAIAALEPELRRRADMLIDAFPDGEPFDFMAAFSGELPSQAICIVLGVPQEDRAQLCEWIDLGIEADSPTVVAKEYLYKVRDYAIELIAEKRRRPREDIFSRIVHARLEDADGRVLSDEELVNFFLLLFPAGAETTRNAFGLGLKTLIEQPEQFARLRQEPKLMKSAAEEIVRWTTPSIYKRRTATRDTELAGQAIAEGDKVTIWEMSANRDARMFADPFRFDLARQPNRHIGYGFGAHICLGAGLARLELKVGFETLLARIADFALAGEAPYTPNNRLLGLKRLPITINKKERPA